MKEQKSKSESDILTALVVISCTIISFFSTYAFKGLFRKKTWTKAFIVTWGAYMIAVVLIVFAPRWNVPMVLDYLSLYFLPVGCGRWVYLHISRLYQIPIIFGGPFLLYLFCIGIFDLFKNSNPQKAIDHLGLKTSTGLTPKVKSVVDLPHNQKKILVHAAGIDIADLQSKRGALQSGLNAIVQDVRVSPMSRQMYEIITSDKELPTLVSFDETSLLLTKPYSFLVGQGMDGLIVAELCEIHHMLVAGATGGGKSVFFKQVLVGLLKSSLHLQLYLIDLKRGVDMKPFENLNNVRVAKETIDAIAMLKAIVEEMEKRFSYLENKGFTEIDPKRDKLDRIVVGIDEASELFTVGKSSKATKENAILARELADKIAKLGRAAGIHVILATQKVVKETIDTRVQTNINARMCFRVNTVASSMTVLGNKAAAELPEIKGRGVWSIGSRDVIVQVPKLTNEEVIEEVNALTMKFNGDTSPIFKPMLKTDTDRENDNAQEHKDSLGKALSDKVVV